MKQDATLNKNTTLLVISSLFSIFVTSVYANHFLPPSQQVSQHNTCPLMIGLNTGASFSSDTGESKSFPIQDPTTDQFYLYTATKSSQTAYLYGGFLGTEWDWRSHWGIQAGLDFTQTASFSAQGSFLQGADVQSADTYSYQYDMLSRQLLLDGKLFYILKKRFRPYILIGAGSSFNSAYHYTTNVPPFLTFTRIYSNNTTTSFSYAVGIGIDATVTERVRMGIGYRFTDLGKVTLGNAVIDTTSVPGTLSQSHWYANEVLAQLLFIFH